VEVERRMVAPAGNPIRVLVVDDDDEVRTALVELLEFHGGFHIVGEAADGAPAPRLVAELQPDLVVIDLRMPIVGGIKAVQLIRDVDAGVKVVVLSAYDDPALVTDALAAGAFDYLVKGCPAGELFDALDRAWRSGRGSKDAR
jgi:DNA-binding NarL/FixJ family response regulator